jgi:hypothetical protein
VPYAGDPADVIPGAVWFALRGMGLKDAAIAAHFNRDALAVFARTIVPEEPERRRS